MQFPESWLREFCDPALSSAELADTLTMGGLEVESSQPFAPAFSGVVVGAVLSTTRHPNADRLNVCLVDVGTAEPLTIVCGAPNVREGVRVPCALVGAALPPAEPGGPPFAIRLGLLRGVESQGMLCSARELGLSDDKAGLLELAGDAPVGADLRVHLRLDDTLLTLKLTPNLGHALSVYGVARELAALTGAPLRALPTTAVEVTQSDTVPVRVDAVDLCARFSGRTVRGLDATAPTPAWIVERLGRCGQRSVSALVDISNYVMFECGQPTHIFDRDRLHGGLTVRWGRSGESLKLLNGQTVALDASVGVIADDDAVESLAGIMGGDATAVSDTTRSIYIEAAHWRPEAVAGRSRRYKFATDAGHRFERGVDPAATVATVERVTALVLEVCGGAAGPLDDRSFDVDDRSADVVPVTLRVDRAARVIGMPLTQAQCADALRRLGFDPVEGDGTVTVQPPSWRFDLRIEEDLIEEVIRVVGYGALSDGLPQGALRPEVGSETRREPSDVRERLARLGYTETINFSFVAEASERTMAGNAAPVRLLNPMSSALGVLRSSLIGSLVGVLRSNLAHKAAQVRVFEIGRVFLRDALSGDGPLAVAGLTQPMRVAGLAYGNAVPLQWGVAERRVDVYDVKADVEALFAPNEVTFVPADHPALHPGRSARIDVGGRAVGHLGELHPRWRQEAELPASPIVFEVALDAVALRPMLVHAPLPRQQSVWRDIALVVPDAVTAAAMSEAIGAADHGGLLRDVTLFDVYKPKQPGGDMASDERSWALRLELRDDASTLTESRIDDAVQRIVAAVGQALGARLRG